MVSVGLPSLNTYHLTWVSLTLVVECILMAAPAKCSHCSLPWTRRVSPHGRPSWSWTWSSSSRPSCTRTATAPWTWGCSSWLPPLASPLSYHLPNIRASTQPSNPLQYSCLENPMDRGVWRDMVHRVTKSQTQLKWLGTHTHTQLSFWAFLQDYFPLLWNPLFLWLTSFFWLLIFYWPLKCCNTQASPLIPGSSVSLHFDELRRPPYFDASPTSVLSYGFLYPWGFSRETKASRMHT